MIKSHASLVLLSALLLCSAPAAAAWIPQEGLQISGAQPSGPGAYAALEGSLVTVAFRANQGDTIWVFAAALDKTGQPDYANLLTLLFDKSSANGMISGVFQVPHGLAGQSFVIVGLALTVDGDLIGSKVTMHIRAALPADVLVDVATPDDG